MRLSWNPREWGGIHAVSLSKPPSFSQWVCREAGTLHQGAKTCLGNECLGTETGTGQRARAKRCTKSTTRQDSFRLGLHSPRMTKSALENWYIIYSQCTSNEIKIKPVNKYLTYYHILRNLRWKKRKEDTSKGQREFSKGSQDLSWQWEGYHRSWGIRTRKQVYKHAWCVVVLMRDTGSGVWKRKVWDILTEKQQILPVTFLPGTPRNLFNHLFFQPFPLLGHRLGQGWHCVIPSHSLPMAEMTNQWRPSFLMCPYKVSEFFWHSSPGSPTTWLDGAQQSSLSLFHSIHLCPIHHLP